MPSKPSSRNRVLIDVMEDDDQPSGVCMDGKPGVQAIHGMLPGLVSKLDRCYFRLSDVYEYHIFFTDVAIFNL